MKDGLPPNKTPITDKRQKILDEAFVEMRKAQNKMNPKFLERIRDLVKNSPAMIEKLGLKKSEIPKKKPKLAEKPKSAVSEKAQPLSLKEKSYEKIDQAKNIDVISKLMEISPDKKDKIVKMLSDK